MDQATSRRLTLLTMCMSQGMILLDVTIVNVALPSMQHELHMSPGRLEWVISAYALTLATLIPLGGTLGDRLGRKRLFLLGLTIFTLASIGCALSRTDLMLIGFRVLEGVGGAVMSALTLSLLSEAYPPERRAGAIGVWAAVAGLGFGAGPIVGGVLLSVASWSSIFWVNVPVGVVGLVVGAKAVAESKDPVARPIDILGAALCIAGLFSVTLALIESSSLGWGSAFVLAALLGGLFVLGAFFTWERRTRHPMAPPVLLRTRSFRWSCLAYLLAYGSFTGVMFYVTLIFQDVRGWSPLRTGLSWLAMNLPFLVVAQLAGRLHRRYSGRGLMALGLFLAGAGVASLSQVGDANGFAVAAVGYALVGLGFGIFAPAVTNAAMAEVPLGASGIASGILNAGRQVGTSVGLTVLGTIGASATLGAWGASLASASPSVRSAGHHLNQAVTGGQVAQAGQKMGSHWTAPATDAFLHGYQVALLVGAAMLIVGSATVLLGLRAKATRPAEAEAPTGARPVTAGGG